MKDRDKVIPPGIDINPYYNPFEPSSITPRSPRSEPSELEKENMLNWEKLYEGFENKNISGDTYPQQQLIGNYPEETAGNGQSQGSQSLQIKNKFILTPVKSGLMIIDQKRAHERILFEQYMEQMQYQHGVVQRSLFPETLELTFAEFSCLREIIDDVQSLGFEMEILEDNKVEIKGYPAESATMGAADLLKDIIQACMTDMVDLETERKEKIAARMAQASAIPYGKSLSNEEMKELVDHLFGCSIPNFSPSGKTIISIINLDELDKRF
jgi:DNA mismatch repair protein MutL